MIDESKINVKASIFVFGLITGIIVGLIFYGVYINFFYPKYIPNIELAKENACKELVNSGCSENTNSIVVINWDANRDGKIDGNDTLFELCKNWYACKDETCCKVICGC